ncbi:MAG TPA: outer membrane lipid asymmetry maintenance protein MlaD [Telluria sp.]|nr:outer membrane lipid asymmetry maintenance protein MlaD [Telluria sp.]
MHRKTIDLWVGLFVIAGAASLLFLALKAGNVSSIGSFKSIYTISAKFDNIGGLKPQAAVKSAGVVVGRVTSIRFDDKSYQALVMIDMDAGYKFPKDSSAKILTAGLLGEQYVGIEPGGDTANLGQGDRIARTQSAAVLEDLINQFIYSKAAEGKGGSQ